MLLDLKPADRLTARLFGQTDFERAQRVMKAVDEINRQMGRDTIRFGIVQPNGRWQTKALRRSRRYTTCLSEVLRVS
jgi:DNA polymerase V